MVKKTIKQIGELGFLNRLYPQFKIKDKDIIVGLGDDAAVISPHLSDNYILTTDMLVEGTHFDLRYTPSYQLGRKSIAVNVSDIAAMGGTPLYVLTSMGFPPDFPLSDINDFYKGLKYECRKWGCELIGGDTVRSHYFVINIAMIGISDVHRIIPLRSSASENQYIYVTGSLGESRAGLELFNSKKAPDSLRKSTIQTLKKRHLLPIPRLDISQCLVKNLNNLSMIDVSDGLYNELHLISKASNIGMEIWLDKIYVSKDLKKFCDAQNKNVYEYLLFGGEDYELLFSTSVSPEQLHNLCFHSKLSIPFSHIGITTDRKKGIAFYHNGKKVTIKNKTFAHF